MSLPAPNFNLSRTLASGQVFHWMPDDPLDDETDAFVGLIGSVPIRLATLHRADALRVSPPEASELAADYLGLHHPMESIHASFPSGDVHLAAAIAQNPGLRLVRQPLWECLATFITSSMKQVAHIRQMSLALRRLHGNPLDFGVHRLHTYPEPSALAAASEESLRRDIRLGYRAPHLLATARRIASGEFSLAALENLPFEEAARALRTLPGVGEKIAHCVLLFGYARWEAFPVDVWIARSLRKIYFPQAPEIPLPRLRAFAAAHFGPHGGYAQQYLFCAARQAGRGSSRRGRQRSSSIPG